MTTVQEDAPTHRGDPDRFATLGGVLKFAMTAAALAMVADALVAHAILWQNDPYWTYWVTDTFLITTIFGLGTAWFGAGIGRGAVLTVVQTLVLTTYYWSLSPIGLPTQPEWLDFQHTWVTGLPVHFGVYYLGYLTALWLWRRRAATHELSMANAGSVEVSRSMATPGSAEVSGSMATPGSPTGAATAPASMARPAASDRGPGADAGRALVTAAAIVGVVGALQTVLLGEFPGLTWFIVHLVITVPFTLAWWAVAGRDRAAAVAGGITLGVLLTAYTHYLGPVGLPDTDLRVLAQDLPPSPVHWLSYREEVLVVFPITVLIAVVAFVAASMWRGQPWTPLGLSRLSSLVSLASTAAVVALGVVAAGHTGTADERATVTSAGRAQAEVGDYYHGDLVPAEGQLRLVAESRNAKTTPLPPHDRLDLEATVTHDGTRYEVRADRAMVADPLGRWGTWAGVGYDRWHHGRSGAGASAVPATRSGVAVYALGDVHADGELIATGVPIHAMTVADGGVELHVGDPASPLPALPDGHLRVVWEQRTGDNPEGAERARHLLGGGILVALLALAATALRREDAPLV